MEIIPGYWVCSCGYFNDEALTWCVECTKERVEDYKPPSITLEDKLNRGYPKVFTDSSQKIG